VVAVAVAEWVAAEWVAGARRCSTPSVPHVGSRHGCRSSPAATVPSIAAIVLDSRGDRRRTAMAKKVNSAFMKPLQPSEALSKVTGEKPLPRSEVAKKLWVYIKKNGLQDKVNRRMINADDVLKVIFNGKKQVSMFEMTALVSKHLK
jgi:chromatin remodeling complex protein RSC6